MHMLTWYIEHHPIFFHFLPSMKHSFLPLNPVRSLELFLVFAGLPPWGKFYFLCSPKCFWHYGRAFAFLHFISTVTVTSKLKKFVMVNRYTRNIFRLFGLILPLIWSNISGMPSRIPPALRIIQFLYTLSLSYFVLSLLSALLYRETK